MRVQWSDLRSVPATSLAIGEQWLSLEAGAAYRESSDGRIQPVLHGWDPPRGTLWTVTAIEAGGTVRVRGEDGRAHSGIPRESQRVLRVESAAR